ncbi:MULTISPECIES: glycosyltransferase family A protein [unclassified Mesorhizobium]|uniref:glycosyltransferase family 2 protein n=1 Tax=unclassified Mesorhizobium TaxID=325217 RepID=UPI000FE9E7E6|nr:MULTISPECIES: glycosyltransferase family A protein [unclassified Mesorhizobium]RWI14719.1 MAG: glycosyltransferase family 2 protein [Mesorhizobium sp.]RWK47302.1 MAG: glycosyltransferase family 2 protein [Mesorhizobium sp.]RWK94693.1 MAG: glycosyltransferase family 2 protein [Mesorhizobium sp.]TIP61069.1 MAG: glycosyltransferase family 2 protein [Mesorhizobium sp.]TIQ21130.1 MAG: glycosyltransferase family 2 protein [Mesorhizobium sp.]
MPQVSIVIPVHNQPMLILEAVASLKAQSVADWEAILVDDGSTDETPAVLENLASQDARISLWLQTQQGAAAARNTGAAKAKADWLLFLDSDDWLAPNALGSLLRVAGQDVHLVHALGLRVCGSRSQDRSQVHLPRGDLFHRLASTATFMVHACILKNSTFHELGGFDETLMGCADWDLWQRVIRSGARCRGVDEIVAFYRQNEASLSTNYEQELRDGLIVIARGHGPDPRVPRPHPGYAEGISLAEFPAAAYRFVSWLAGVAIAREHSVEGILRGMQALPAKPLAASDIGAALFDAIPIGLGDFRPNWGRCWPALRPHLQEFLEEVGTIAHCGPSFTSDVLHHTERLAATANASDTIGVVGGVASRIVRIPGAIPHLNLAPDITSFIAVVRTDRAEVGPMEVLVDGSFSDGRVREMLVERYLREVFSTYLRRFPFSILFGTMKYTAGQKKLFLSLASLVKDRSAGPLLRKHICQALLAQNFVLPTIETGVIKSRLEGQITS